MSTRAQIKVSDQPIYIYKHSDGYPEGVMPTLEPAVKYFHEQRGYDPEYMVARILMAFALAEEKFRQERIKEFERLRNSTEERLYKMYSKPEVLGFGLDLQVHGDIQYMYHVDARTGEIRVEEV